MTQDEAQPGPMQRQGVLGKYMTADQLKDIADRDGQYQREINRLRLAMTDMLGHYERDRPQAAEDPRGPVIDPAAFFAAEERGRLMAKAKRWRDRGMFTDSEWRAVCAVLLVSDVVTAADLVRGAEIAAVLAAQSSEPKR